jgi:hypothetical protein
MKKFLVFCLVLPVVMTCNLDFVIAQDPTVLESESADMPILKGLNETAIEGNLTGEGGEYLNLTGRDLVRKRLGDAVSIAVGLSGFLFFLLTLYGGFVYMTAGGDPAQTKKGRNWIIWAAIGLGVILISYGLANFVLELLSKQA